MYNLKNKSLDALAWVFVAAAICIVFSFVAAILLTAFTKPVETGIVVATLAFFIGMGWAFHRLFG